MPVSIQVYGGLAFVFLCAITGIKLLYNLFRAKKTNFQDKEDNK